MACQEEVFPPETQHYKKPSRFISVSTFLKYCARRLKIPEYYCQPFSFEKNQNIQNFSENCIVTVHFQKGKTDRIKTCKVYDPYHQLMKDEYFNPTELASGGTRRVGIYKVDKEKCLCFKEDPEAPEHDVAVHKLYESFFPKNRDIPASMTISMNGRIFLVSEYIDHTETLEQAFEKVKKNQYYGNRWHFDQENFQRLAIVSLFINPEDGRPANYLIRKKQKNEYMLVSIDHERCLGKEFATCTDSEGTRVHCSLFCFLEMLQEELSEPLQKQLKEKIKNLNTLIKKWDDECQIMIKYQQRLQRKLKVAEKLFEFPYIHDEEAFIRSIITKANIINEVCDNKGNFSDILDRSNRKLANLYLIAGNEEQPNHLRAAYERAVSVDKGRFASSAPPSSYISLSAYFGSPLFSLRSKQYSRHAIIDKIFEQERSLLFTKRHISYYLKEWRFKKTFRLNQLACLAAAMYFQPDGTLQEQNEENLRGYDPYGINAYRDFSASQMFELNNIISSFAQTWIEFFPTEKERIKKELTKMNFFHNPSFWQEMFTKNEIYEAIQIVDTDNKSFSLDSLYLRFRFTSNDAKQEIIRYLLSFYMIPGRT